MLRFAFLLSFCFYFFGTHAQQTITVKKQTTLFGFYQLLTENKTKEFLYFDKEGNVAIITSNKRKKAKGNLVACVENNNCGRANKSTYSISELEISFSFNKGSGENIHFIEYEGKLSSDALFITLKKGETNKLIEVKEFRRLK